MTRVVVTGGLGFIGSALARRLAPDCDVIAVDSRTYAADPARLAGSLARIRIEEADVAERDFIRLMRAVRPDVIAHLAAETHVTRSERAPASFERTNVQGTRNVIDAADQTAALLVHVSTDEVYGPIVQGAFSESDKTPGDEAATSPYAKSKARGDDLAVDAMSTVPTIVARPTNCYGPWQHPEKAVARWVTRALLGERIPVWGDGSHSRDWMFVEDVCSALVTIIERAHPGQVFNVAPEHPETTNLELAQLIASVATGETASVYLTAYDRVDHDRRYRVDASRLRALGWRPSVELAEGVRRTVHWYQSHLEWVKLHLNEAEGLYDDERARVR